LFEAVRVQTALRQRRDAAVTGSARNVPWPPAGLWSPGWLLVAGYLLQVVLRLGSTAGLAVLEDEPAPVGGQRVGPMASLGGLGEPRRARQGSAGSGSWLE
jgi:hypothetical protein